MLIAGIKGRLNEGSKTGAENSKGQKAKQWRAESQTALCEQTGGALARKQE